VQSTATEREEKQMSEKPASSMVDAMNNARSTNMKVELPAEDAFEKLNVCDFLEEWLQMNVYEQGWSEGEDDDLYSQCLADAEDQNIAEGELEAAAGGDLLGYIREAIGLAERSSQS
jgi:hypothetical protein